MYTIHEAIKVFNKTYEKLVVTKAADFDENNYLLNAVEDPNDECCNDPFYLINKKNGFIYRFLPQEDFDKFIYAINNREIDLGGLNIETTRSLQKSM